MHGTKLVSDMLKEVLARCEGRRVELVRLKVGADCHAQPDEIEYFFRLGAKGSQAAGAKLEIEKIKGDDLILESIRVE